jgi:hypothetical protein
MAMQKPQKQRRFQDGGYLLDGSGNRVKSGSGEYVRTGSYDKEADMESARNKLAQDVQEKLKADKADKAPAAAVQSSKASDGDVDERDRRMEAAASAPSRMPGQSAPKASAPKAKSGMVTKEQLAKSGMSLREYMNQQQGKTARGSSAPAKTPSKPAAKTQTASTDKSDFEAAQRKRSDMIVALGRAEREAPAGTSALAKQKIAESKRKALDEYATAGKAEERKNYVPRATPGARAPKQTTSKAKPYMPEQPDMSYRKGGSVSSASKRADGIAQRGKTRGKVY